MRFVVGLVLVLCACTAACPKGELLTGPDGGVLSCVQTSDCPRISNTLMCGASIDKIHDCVACESLQCIRYQPVACPL